MYSVSLIDRSEGFPTRPLFVCFTIEPSHGGVVAAAFSAGELPFR